MSAYRKGWKAYEQGDTSALNPFTFESQSKAFREWESGWYESRDENPIWTRTFNHSN